MADVFISYSRTDMTFAKRLHASLEAGGVDSWIDWQDIPPSADWLAEVYEAIEATDAFIFIMSKESVNSEVCSYEVQHAAENNKRLIPIVLDDIDPRQVPPSIAALNWIFFRESDDCDQALTRLMEAIRIDQSWLKAHTRYQNRALDWERHQVDPGFLLQGRDLEGAEAWLAEAAGKDPQPTALQAQFFQAGRRVQNRRSRRMLTGASLAIIITAALGIVAWSQRSVAVQASAVRATAQSVALHEADTRATAESVALEEAAMRATAQVEAVIQREEAQAQRITASSRQLAAEAMIHLKPDELELALLLAVAGTQIEDTPEARASLLRALMYRPHLIKLLTYDPTGTYGFGLDLAFSFESKSLGGFAQVGRSESNRAWDIESGRLLEDTSIPPELDYWDLNEDSPTWGGHAAFDPNQTLLAIYEKYNISVYDVSSKTLIYQLFDPYHWVKSLAFNPQGTILVSGDMIEDSSGKGIHGNVLLWDMASGQLLGDPLIGPEYFINRLQFNTDGNMLVAIGRPNGKWTAFGPAQVYRWLMDDEGITRLDVIYLEESSWNVFYDQHTENLIAEDNGEVRIYSLASGEVLGRPFNVDPVYLNSSERMAMSPDGRYLAANGEGGRVFLYDLVDRVNSIQVPLPETSDASAFAYTSNGERLFVASCDTYDGETQTCSQSHIDLWDSRTFSLMQSSIQTQKGVIHSLSIGEDDRLITGDSTAFHLHTSNDLTRMAYIHDDGQLNLYDYEDATSSNRILLLDSFTSSDLTFSPDGTMLAAVGEDGVLLLSAEDGHELEHLWAGIPLQAITFNTEGDRLYAGGSDGSLYAWDLIEGESITEPLSVHSYPITGIAMQPNGHLLVSADAGGYLVLWDMLSLKPLMDPIPADLTSIHAVTFDPTGDTFALLGEMGVSVWKARLSAWQDPACQIANRDLTPEEWALFLGDLPYQHVCIQEE